jgi:hypothetical protein
VQCLNFEKKTFIFQKIGFYLFYFWKSGFISFFCRGLDLFCLFSALLFPILQKTIDFYSINHLKQPQNSKKPIKIQSTEKYSLKILKSEKFPNKILKFCRKKTFFFL